MPNLTNMPNLTLARIGNILFGVSLIASAATLIVVAVVTVLTPGDSPFSHREARIIGRVLATNALGLLVGFVLSQMPARRKL